MRAAGSRDVIAASVDLSKADDVKTVMNTDGGGLSPNHARRREVMDSVSGGSSFADDDRRYRPRSSQQNNTPHEQTGEQNGDRCAHVKTEIESPPPRGPYTSGLRAASTSEYGNDVIRAKEKSDADWITDDVTWKHHKIHSPQLQLMRQSELQRLSPIVAANDLGGRLGSESENRLRSSPFEVSMTKIKLNGETGGRLSARSMRFSIASLLEIGTAT